MAVTPGYKQTDLGIIPIDWDIARIDQLASITTGSRNTQDRAEDGSYPFFVRSQQVERINTYSYDGEAVLTVGDGVGTGKVFHYINGKFDVHQRVYRTSQFSDRLNGRYFFYQFSSRFYRRSMSMTAKSSVDSVRLEMIAGMRVPVPPPAEQRAIAAALSDVDALLDGLDRLIAKKRDLKQAAMQQLLTGQTRLPGFSAEWVARPLCEVGDIKSGGTPNTTQAHFWNGGVPWCTPTDVTALRGRKYLIDTARTISTAGLQFSSAEVIPPRSLIMTSRATIGECAINIVPMTTNQGFKSIVTFAEIDVEFLYYLLTTQKTSLVALCAGSTFLEIGKKQLSGYMVTLPRDRVEQEAIATVLSDMDVDIAALEARRDKTHDLKQAMMQELLTGKTRLVQPEVVHA